MYQMIEINSRILTSQEFTKRIFGFFEKEEDTKVYVHHCYEQSEECSKNYDETKKYWEEYLRESSKVKTENSTLLKWQLYQKIRFFNRWYFKNNPPKKHLRKFFDYDYHIKLINYFSDERKLALKDYFTFD